MAQFAPVAFLKQTLNAFHTTGAIAPSSSYVAKEIVRAIPEAEQLPKTFRVLEVGPGTGPFSSEIALRMKGHGHFDIYEINDEFVKHLRERIEHEACFQPMKKKIKLCLGNVLELNAPGTYDAIVCGLPFNNFAPEDVRTFFEHFRALAKKGGTLSFFEYVGVRPLQKPFVSKERRARVKEIAAVVHEFTKAYQYRQKVVLPNMPPARVRHLRFG